MKHHQIALWAGVASFFATLLAIGIFDIFNPEQWLQWLGSIIVAFITAGSVYAKQRLDDAKKELKLSGSINMTETPQGLSYVLELNGHPEDLQNQDEVTFKVKKIV